LVVVDEVDPELLEVVVEWVVGTAGVADFKEMVIPE
jgi:hypothetical protein